MYKYLLKAKYSVMMLLSLVVLASPVFASVNYEEREGIFGEIKYAEFCNHPNSIRYKIIAEAGSRDARVVRVDPKIYFRRLDVIPVGESRVVTNIRSATWRAVRPAFNTDSGDRRWYEVTENHPGVVSVHTDTPIKFAIHVVTETASGRTNVVYDLGGIVDLGTVPHHTCRIYDDGVFK